jgi:hypothetical protein
VGGRRERAGGGCCSADARPFDPGGGHRHGEPPGGELYRALRAALPPSVDLQVVDPGNWAWLVPSLVTAARRQGLSGRPLARRVREGLRAGSVLVDGEPVTTAETADTAVTAVRERLGVRG